MNCNTHGDIAAVAFCRTCGKPLCQNCTRDVRGVIYCETCLAAKVEASAQSAAYTPPQSTYQQVIPPGAGTRVPPPGSSGPQPVVAGILAGFFPFGVGAVYCSQYAKGFAHLLIFALLIFAGNHAGSMGWIFGVAWVFFYVYQIIDAVRTAKALQLGEPAPDPLGLGQAFGGGTKFEAGKVPLGAVILIGLGVLFLLHTMGLWEFGLDRFWPLLIVALGVWLFYRRLERTNRTCACGRCRTRGIMGPAMVLTTGVLLLLQTATPFGIDRTFPAWILVVGIVMLLQNTASSAGHVGPLPPGPPPGSSAPPTQPPPPTPTEGSSGEVNHV